MKLLSVKKSTAKGKKWTATFQNGEKTKKVNFGATGYTDYTKGATDEQRKSYRARHKSGATAAPDTPNALSYNILWGSSKSFSSNLSTFKKKYNL